MNQARLAPKQGQALFLVVGEADTFVGAAICRPQIRCAVKRTDRPLRHPTGDTSPYRRGGLIGAVEVKRELSSRPCGEIPSTIGAPNGGFFDNAQNDRR